MAGEDIVTMSQKELGRIHVIRKVIDKVITQIEASNILGLSTRQIRRITRRVAREGDKGVIHKSRARHSLRAFSQKLKNRIIGLCTKRYVDFGPTLASEKLFERDKITVSRETLRGWFKQQQIAYATRKKRPHRSWRERRAYFGQMQQVDGSHHDWLEGRGPRCVLMGYIDDANNNVFARFYDYEGTFPFMDSFRRYARKYGLPQSIYIDRHAAYKSKAKPSIEDELRNREPLTQVGRALAELGVEAIFAHCAPAKGRIERLFRTFQDRLVKEMRLRGIQSVTEANVFLGQYLPGYNRRFRVEPLEKGNMHRPLPKDIHLETILCIKSEHRLNNDSTVAHDKKLYLVTDKIHSHKVEVQERLNGTLQIMHKGHLLRYRQISRRPKKEQKPRYALALVRKERYRPPMDHPFKRRMFLRRCAQEEAKKRLLART